MKKRALFLSVLLIVELLLGEFAMRAIHFVRYGRFSHVLPLSELHTVRQVVPYQPGVHVTPTVRGYFLVKNGYFTVDPHQSILDPTGVRPPVNSLGFRGAEPAPKNGRRRIWCLGGSTTYGYGVEHSYPDFLQSRLDHGGDVYQVINGGMYGTDIVHISHMLDDEEFVARVAPDIVVLSTTGNSIEMFENNVLVDTIESQPLRALARRSLLAFAAYKGILWLRYRESLGPEQNLAVYVDRICEWAQRHHVTLILMNEPTRLTTATWGAAPDHPVTHARSAAVLRRAVARSKGGAFYVEVPFFETTSWTPEDLRRYVIQRGHFTEAGYQKVADSVAEAIEHLPPS